MAKQTDPLSAESLIELIRLRAALHPERIAYRYLNFKPNEHDQLLTFRDLYLESRKVAAALIRNGAIPGDRALLLYPPGNDYFNAFLGCMMAGVIGIPLYPPKRNKSDSRIVSVSLNSEADFMLSTSELCAIHAERELDTSILDEGVWIGTDQLPDDPIPESSIHDISQEDIIYLQYTSGSTSEPKGVQMTNENVMGCLRDLHRLYGHGEQGCTVNWLPHFHDMGLIFGNLLPLLWGHTSVIMAPSDFVQQPYRWLKAITDFKATSSAGPNFSYQLCLDKLTDEQADSLDLSSWKIAFIAAEHNRRETIEGFTKRFKPAGFSYRSMAPAWGQAESTLNITAVPLDEEIRYISLDKDEMANDRLTEVPAGTPDAVSLVGAGWTSDEQEVCAVDSDTFEDLGEMNVGELWLKGPLVGKGYWNNPEKTKENFQAYTKSGKGPYLRTGDLGFIKEKQVYITGRLKDIIIIRGLNYYPQDIEITVQKSHEALRIDAGAAFSIDVDGQERLVIAQEIERSHFRDYNEHEIFTAIRKAVSEAHELQVHHIVILFPQSILKTSSGKIQHLAMKAAYENGELKIVTQSDPLVYTADDKAPQHVTEQLQTGLTYDQVAQWLTEWITRTLGIPGDMIHPRESLLTYGMDSMTSVKLSEELISLTGRPLSPAVVYDYPSISKMARHLSGSESNPAVLAVGGENINEPIAVIGTGCRFPGADGPDQFWDLLKNGESGITEVPPSRWDSSSWYDPDLNDIDSMNTKWGGFLKEIEFFDNSFFHIPYREACMMDPQQRLLLEVTYEALEQAGMPSRQLEGSMTGVFVGVTSNEFYKKLKVSPSRGGTGVNNSITANRLSYHFDWRGPSYAIDTACSSSLYAIHQACQSLRLNESSMAVAGGVNVVLSPDYGISFSQAGMMASDGHCKTFDEKADGYVRSEGCGVVILKRLSDARRDDDTILALIRGSAINQDGRSNGLTAPNGVSQVQVIHQALKNAGLKASDIDYLEAHGSGTPLGDVIEVRSAAAVYSDSDNNRCGLGSVKANIGHLESAAGIAGLIKSVLMLRHGSVPPQIHFQKANKDLLLEKSPFVISTKDQPSNLTPNRIGISSFGFGGANAHVILERSPVIESKQAYSVNGHATARGEHVVVISADSKKALKNKLISYQGWLQRNGDYRFDDIVYTLNARRDHFDFRLSAVCKDREDFEFTLKEWLKESEKQDWLSEKSSIPTPSKCAFLFPGQGTRYRFAAMDLYQQHPLFRESIQLCSELIGNRIPIPLTDLLYGDIDPGTDLNQTIFVQPALFSLGYALFRYWTSLGVEPAALMGHSLGEITAAAAAGVMNLDDAVNLVCSRAECMQNLPADGAMAAVIAETEEVEEVMKKYEDLTIAGFNTPRQIVISGVETSMQKALADFDERSILTIPLEVSHAFHSNWMEPAIEPFLEKISSIPFQRTKIPLVSNVTGEFSGHDILDAEYWAEQISKPVRFRDGIESLADFGITHFIELGPSDTLINLGKKCIGPERQATWKASLKPEESAWTTSADLLSELYRQGWELNWKAWFEGMELTPAALPTYPFQRKRCWPEEYEIESPVKRVGK